MAGLFASRAVLSSVGVGDASASPTAALLLSVLQDSIGRLATIAFAHKFGLALEPECKMWRLAADIFNDTAMVLDCASPALPRPLMISALTTAGVLRALCGVAAGSSKASLSKHFAKWGNLGELNAVSNSSCIFAQALLDPVISARRWILSTRSREDSGTYEERRAIFLPFDGECDQIADEHQKDSSQETIISLLGMLVRRKAKSKVWR